PDGRGIRNGVPRLAEKEFSAGVYSELNTGADFVFHGDNIRGRVHMKNVAFRTYPHVIKRVAGPDAHGDERAVRLVAGGYADVPAVEGRRFRREILDGCGGL